MVGLVKLTYTNGQLLIGNTTGNTLDKATLTAGSNVTITNGGGSITIASADTDTTYTAGDGLDLSGTTFSTDLKANGGLVIESTELALDLGASSITGTLAVSDGGTGQTYTDGQLLIGNTTGNTLAKAVLSGDVTMTNAGVVTIGAEAVEPTMIERYGGSGAESTNATQVLAWRSGDVNAKWYNVANVCFLKGTKITLSDGSTKPIR